jgi:hypothetical protein
MVLVYFKALSGEDEGKSENMTQDTRTPGGESNSVNRECE